MNRIRGHLTFANVVSLLALFVALGGTSYALTLGENSVGAKQIKRNAVGAPEIRKGAVRSSEVKDDALLLGDFKAAERAKLQGPPGERGPQGERGTPGLDGTSTAYGRVNGYSFNPPIIQAASPNVAGVTRSGAGAYCVSFSEEIPQDRLDAAVAGGWFSIYPKVVLHSNCGAGKLGIFTFNNAGALTDASANFVVP